MFFNWLVFGTAISLLVILFTAGDGLVMAEAGKTIENVSKAAIANAAKANLSIVIAYTTALFTAEDFFRRRCAVIG